MLLGPTINFSIVKLSKHSLLNINSEFTNQSMIATVAKMAKAKVSADEYFLCVG